MMQLLRQFRNNFLYNNIQVNSGDCPISQKTVLQTAETDGVSLSEQIRTQGMKVRNLKSEKADKVLHF